jgi:hypothetical protein
LVKRRNKFTKLLPFYVLWNKMLFVEDKKIEDVWARLPFDKESLGQPSHSKGYVMAILYMIHIEAYNKDKRPRDIKGPDSQYRLPLLKNYAAWVPCPCHGGCDLEWNFADDRGIFRGSGSSRCEIQILRGVKRRTALAGASETWKSMSH